MARRNAKVLPTSVQETLTDAPDFLRELVHVALQEVLESEMTTMWVPSAMSAPTRVPGSATATSPARLCPAPAR